jgi:hypothetical protein
MRAALLASIGLLGGCPMSQGGGECSVDRECLSSEVCARDNSCATPSNVRDVKAVWTLRGMPANDATCAAHPDLFINFGGGPGESIGYSPVPCALGQFVITKLPKSYTRVELGVHNRWAGEVVVDSSNQAKIDLLL